MAGEVAITVTPKELERQAVEAFQGKSWRVFLALRQDTGLDATSTIAAWEAEKVPTANGYVDVTGTVGTGVYNTGTAAYELPALQVTFTATGAGYSYDSIIVQIDGATYPHSVGLFSADTPIFLAGGQSQSYSVLLTQDNG
jgi:hypothetical protein